MYYGYDICPKCKNKLIERREAQENKTEFAKYSGNDCFVCGEKMVLACVGEKKIDNTIYKITLEEVFNCKENEENYIKTIMKIGNFDVATARNKLNAQGSIIFEGDFFNTYKNMELLDDIGSFVYNVTPPFSFTRFVYHVVCPVCGGKTIEKTEEMQDLKNYVKKGIFCESCNDWVLQCSINKMNIDDTIYNIMISFRGIECKEKEEVLNIVEDLQNKKVSKDEIIVCDKANIIYEILQKLEAININYKIAPPFPYEICKFSEEDEKFLNDILKFNQVD